MRAAAVALIPLVVIPVVLAVGCGPEEPVLSAVPTATDRSTSTPRPYERPDGVSIDASYLGGRSYDRVRDVVQDQAGTLHDSRTLPGDDGEELQFERATLRVADGTIAMIRVTLDEPMSPADALASLGFTGPSGQFVSLSGELLLNHSYGQRRIRLEREAPKSELVTEVECWHHVPTEATSRR